MKVIKVMHFIAKDIFYFTR